MFKVKIAGMGKAVGSLKVKSQELEEQMNVTSGWIVKATGIDSRHYVNFEDGENALTLGIKAAKQAIKNSGIDPKQIDCIIGANGSPLQAIPCGASLFQRELGLGDSGIPCFDVDSTCYSFGLALFVAANLIHNQVYNRILIISSDAPSPTLLKTSNEVRALFGDGAAAAIVTKSEKDGKSALQHFKMQTYGSGADLTCVKGGGTLRHPNDPKTRIEDNLFQMDGRKVFRYAVRLLPDFFKDFFSESGICQSDVKYLFPHQTSKHGIDIFRKFGFRSEQIASHISTHGNCIAASLPMLLYDYIEDNRIKRGDLVLLFGTSAGLSIGCVALTY
ncbi:3-oxoacyl-[acyl-carrier-protein] synthase III C-terminal domain-containing protein [Anoxybacillus eryuanensis]|uniref:3-oxoacyl-[acyl-carrier-protein] synthase III C-terminal domain-containing protein n=1 Tax=Anoxybacillus eryuanensis TaxID=651866 RepID=UPI003EF1586B